MHMNQRKTSEMNKPYRQASGEGGSTIEYNLEQEQKTDTHISFRM